jgi:integrase
MKYIREKLKKTEVSYDIYIDNLKIKEVFIQRITKEHMNYPYVFLLDSNCKVIEVVFEYLNHHCRENGQSGRDQAASALKLLYSFLEIKGKSIEQLDKNDIKFLSNFLQGIDTEGMIESYEFKTSRSISTHNIYFDAIRSFISAIEIPNKYFFEKRTISFEKNGFGMLGHTKSKKIEKYKTNKSRHASFTTYVPKYISLEEYKRIIKYIDITNSVLKLRNKIMIDLMYILGLRIGEVLGVTIEDLKPHNDNKDAGILLLRNRVSDKKYQHAKGCLKVASKKIYESNSYKEENIGYQTIIITPKMMLQINEYIDESRDILSFTDKKITNIYNYSIADSVEGTGNENYYLFLNKNGAHLSISGWNKELKQIYNAVGIKIDRERKRDNLSHKLRHGMAMYLIELEKKEITYVQRKMRHKSIQSTLCYYNPKPETILKYNETIQESFEEKLRQKDGEYHDQKD